MNLSEIIEKNKEEMFQTLARLIRIPSVAQPAKGEFPFGQGIQEALEFMLKEAEKEGFQVKDFDHYAAHIEWGSGDQILGIPCHLDVVPEGDGWENDPYGGDIVQGKMYGRGACDNKGPLVAVFYAMKALKEAGFQPAKRIRLILGLDEESDWVGMKYYLEKAENPDIGFSPDGDFPLVIGEKGALVLEIAKKFAKVPGGTKGMTLRAISGGQAANIVADTARLLVLADSYENLKEKVVEYRKTTGHHLSYRTKGKSFEVVAEGISAHGATPEAGLNAISILMDFASTISFTSEDAGDVVDFYNKHIGFCTDGSAIGCGFSDEESGKLVFNVGVIEMTPEACRMTVNIRYPLSILEEQVYQAMMPALNKYNMGLVHRTSKGPLCFKKDDPFVKTLMDCYQRHTGDMKTQPLIMNGASYARVIKNCMAFGMLFPGEEDTMHKHDECVSLNSMVQGAKIYADLIAEISSQP